MVGEQGLRRAQAGGAQASLVADGKESACNAGDPGSIPGTGRSTGEGKDYPLQYPCLENPMDREAWWASGLRVAESDTTERLTLSSSHARPGPHLANRSALLPLTLPTKFPPPPWEETWSPKYVTISHSKDSSAGFPGGSVVKNPPANAGNTGLIPGPKRSHVLWSN